MANSEAPTPTIRRVQLGILLRLLRERAALKPKEVAPKLEWYVSKISKLEKGDVTVSAAELDRLIELYAVEDDEAERIRRLGSEARKRDRPQRVPDWGQTYVALETAASEIKISAGELVPGILQTEEYARAMLALWVTGGSNEIEARAMERAQRGVRLHAETPPNLWVVLGEAALHQAVGGQDVLRRQLQHLLELSRLRHVTVQLIPFAGGEHVALGTPFTLLHLNDPKASFVYLEGLTDADYLDRPNHTAVYQDAFDRLRATALGDDESATLIERRIKELF